MKIIINILIFAEGVGVEPTNPLSQVTVFETVRIAIPCTPPSLRLRREPPSHLLQLVLPHRIEL